jgi:aerobic carbon-monoxide dehydrogenase medium subunit
VFPSQFEYHRAASVQEAVQLLNQNPDAKIIAGGHSLLPAMKLRLAAPAALVDIGRIGGLNGISKSNGLTIGALVTYNQITDSADVQAVCPVLAQAASHVGDPQVRARGTIGGSLAHSDPAADLTAVFLALGGSVKVVGSSGERTIAADDLFVDLLTTSLNPDEIITEVQIPAGSGKTVAAYEKHEHPASGYAVVGVAAVLSLDGSGNVSSARLAVTGCTSKATRLAGAEAALAGKPLNADSIAAAAGAAPDGLEINGDHYASADYRRHLVGVLTRRALEKAAG